MRSRILLFCSGLSVINFIQALPSKGGILGSAAIIITLSLGLASLRFGKLIPVFLFCLGLVWGCYNAQQRLEQRLSPSLVGSVLRVSGVISSLPKHSNKSAGFFFDTQCIEELGAQTIDGDPQGRVCLKGLERLHLSWYGYSRAGQNIKLEAGQRWRLDVKLKRPKGLSNPGGFDYEKWLFAQNAGATGYVVNKGQNILLNALPYQDTGLYALLVMRVNVIRESIALSIDDSGQSQVAKTLLKALTIGDKRGVEPSYHNVLAATGTSHLLAVSGLHVGLVSGFVYALIRLIFSIIRFLNQSISAQKTAIALSLLAASGYCALAGFSLPTLRAWIMLACFSYGVLRETSQSAWDSYFVSLLMVCLIQPFAVLELGFWLSYTAVAVILFVISGRVGRGNADALRDLGRVRLFAYKARDFVSEAWRSQWAIFIGLLPLLLVFFGQLPLVSPFINSLAVPFVGILVVPFALLGAMTSFWFSPEGNIFFFLAGRAVDVFWAALEPISTVSWFTIMLPAIDTTLNQVCLVLLCAVLLLPKNVPFRWFGILLVLPASFELLQNSKSLSALEPFLASVSSTEEIALQFTVLDVGQGLAAVIETPNHILVYDTGSGSKGRSDAGSRVVSPYLKSRGVSKIDMLVVSHDDNDHAGGAVSIIDAHRPGVLIAWPDTLGRLRSDQLLAIGEQDACHEFRQWNWDGVHFALFSWATLGGQPNKNNDFSCILKVTGPGVSILLPGDIEKRTEYSLIQRMSHAMKFQCLAFDLRADILVAPHHGSKTSSTSAFIHAVKPRQVIYSAAYGSRFGHPHEKIVTRYEDNNVTGWNTGISGSLSYQFFTSDMRLKRSERLIPEQSRISTKRFWHHVDYNAENRENIGKKRFQWLDLE